MMNCCVVQPLVIFKFVKNIFNQLLYRSLPISIVAYRNLPALMHACILYMYACMHACMQSNPESKTKIETDAALNVKFLPLFPYTVDIP